MKLEMSTNNKSSHISQHIIVSKTTKLYSYIHSNITYRGVYTINVDYDDERGYKRPKSTVYKRADRRATDSTIHDTDNFSPADVGKEEDSMLSVTDGGTLPTEGEGLGLLEVW